MSINTCTARGTAYRAVITIILLGLFACASEPQVQSTATSEPATLADRLPPYDLALENDRVRIWRLALEYSESNVVDSLALPTIRFTQAGGNLVEEFNGQSAIPKSVRAGDVQWLPAGTSVSIRNVGKTEVVILDIEIK